MITKTNEALDVVIKALDSVLYKNFTPKMQTSVAKEIVLALGYRPPQKREKSPLPVVAYPTDSGIETRTVKPVPTGTTPRNKPIKGVAIGKPE